MLPRPSAAFVAAGLTSVALLSACGGESSGSDKPAYCADLSTLQRSVGDLKGVDVIGGGLDAIQAQLVSVGTDAKAVVASAKADFPQETMAISTSVAALDASAKSLGAAPSAAGAVAVAGDVSGVVTAFQGFSDATKDKC